MGTSHLVPRALGVTQSKCFLQTSNLSPPLPSPTLQNGERGPCQKAGSVLKGCHWHLLSWHRPAATFGRPRGWTDDFSKDKQFHLPKRKKFSGQTWEANTAFNGHHSLRPGDAWHFPSPSPPWPERASKPLLILTRQVEMPTGVQAPQVRLSRQPNKTERRESGGR